MNRIFYLLIAIMVVACDSDDSLKMTLDTPIEFKVSKGTYVDKIILEWNKPPKSTHIEIFKYDSSLNEYAKIGSTENDTYVDSSGFFPGSKYYYKIRAFNSSEISDFTNYDYGFVSAFNAPLIENIGYGVSEASVDIQWTTIQGADIYSVYRSENKKDFINLGSTTFTTWKDDTNLIAGQTYYYKIEAFNTMLEQSASSAIDSGYVLERYKYQTSFGSFNYGFGIEVDDQNNIYVGDWYSGTISVYDQNYSFVKTLISTGLSVTGLSWSKAGNLLAVTGYPGILLEIDMNGNILTNKQILNSQLLRETVIDHDGNIYVTDMLNNEVIKLDEHGDFISKWGIRQANAANSFYTTGLEFQDNRIIVGGVNSSEFIEFYDESGDFKAQWNFTYPVAYLSKDSDGNLYFASYTNKIVKTDKAGKIIAFIGHEKLDRCESVKVNAAGIVFASDEYNPDKIHVFTKAE